MTTKPGRRMPGAGGGVADKLGNKYELAWAIRHALFCIRHEDRSITLEEIDPELADGSEFTYINEYGELSVTQVKRQNASLTTGQSQLLKVAGFYRQQLDTSLLAENSTPAQ